MARVQPGHCHPGGLTLATKIVYFLVWPQYIQPGYHHQDRLTLATKIVYFLVWPQYIQPGHHHQCGLTLATKIVYFLVCPTVHTARLSSPRWVDISNQNSLLSCLTIVQTGYNHQDRLTLATKIVCFLVWPEYS